MKKAKEQIVYRKIEDIKLLENNPRYIKGDDFERLCASVQNNPDYFEGRPILLSDRTGELVIIAGNQRYRAAIEVGLKEVPTFLFHGLSEAKEKEIIIRDNVQNGRWDWDMLANGDWEVSDLADWGVDVSFLSQEEEIDLEGLYEEHEAAQKEKLKTITIEIPKEQEDKIEDIKEAVKVTLEEWEGCNVK